jgi:hypothetical protein
MNIPDLHDEDPGWVSVRIHDGEPYKIHKREYGRPVVDFNTHYLITITEYLATLIVAKQLEIRH